MSNCKPCKKSSSSSSSSSSKEDCQVVKEKKVLPIRYEIENVCDKPCVMDAKEIHKKYRHAVVGLHSEITLTASSPPIVGTNLLVGTNSLFVPLAGVTSAPPTDLSTVVLNGNGFFIKDHVIVAPASLVLIPPTILGSRNRYPFLNAPSLPAGVILPAGATFANGTILDTGLNLPFGTIITATTVIENATTFPIGTIIVLGTVIPLTTSLLLGTNMPSGTVIPVQATLQTAPSDIDSVLAPAFFGGGSYPAGFLLPAGSVIPVGFSIPAGTVLPVGTIVTVGTNIPNTTSFPFGTVLPIGSVITAGTVLPIGTVIPSSAIPAGPLFPNAPVRVSRIFADVYNVNCTGHAFTYELDVIGVDGAGDISLLKISKCSTWNNCLPCMEKCHPWFKFGKSRCYEAGEEVYSIGDPFSHWKNLNAFNGAGAIITGTVADNKYLDYLGYAQPELLAVDMNIYAYSAGLPFINKCGRLIGMQTLDVTGAVTTESFINEVSRARPANGGGFVAGPTEFFMKRVVRALFSANKKKRSNYNQVSKVIDPLGDYFVYRKGYLGVAWRVFNGVDYDLTINPVNGLPVGRFDPLTGLPLNGPPCKEVIGIVVDALAGSTAINITVPGFEQDSNFLPSLVDSPLLAILNQGDVITHINKVALGDLHKQVAPTVVTWCTLATDEVNITYRKFSEDYALTYQVCVDVEEFPAFMDYPWYRINAFPLITGPNTPAVPYPYEPDVSFKPAF